MKNKLLWLIPSLVLSCIVSPLRAETGSGVPIDWSKPGITVELLKMVENRVGIQFQFDRAPWKRCLYMVEHGLADATFHASYKPARAEFGVYPTRNEGLDPTRAIYKNAYVFYALKGSGVRWDGKALSNVSRPVGTQLSFAIADDLRKMGYNVAEEGSVAANLDKLAAGRISVYADLESIVDNTLRNNKSPYTMIEKLQPPLKEKMYYLLISKPFAKKHSKLTERIWDAIRDVQQTNAYKEMLTKYED
jgi:polar amino acid transport system substrate-binding protein